MINFADNTLVRGVIKVPIEKWGVWFKTPFGMCESLEEAVATVSSAELNPHMTIEPKPVAFGGKLPGDHYEIVEVYDH